MQKHTIHRAKTGQFSALATTLTYDQESLSELINAPFSLENIGVQMQNKLENYSDETRSTLVYELKKQFSTISPTSPVSKNIEKLASDRTFTVTTGHQLNIVTGPAYVIYKIIHCIRLAEELKMKYPTNDFVPVFWLATEDHDIEEVNHTTLFGKKITWIEQQGGAVGQYLTNNWKEMKAEIASFFQQHPDSEIHHLLEKYEGNTVAEASQQLYHTLFERFGVVVIEPNVRGLKRLFSETMKREVRESFVEQSVLATNKKIEALGFSPQAFARPINLFELSTGKRERLLEVNNESVLKAIHDTPEQFSPNVMLRPAYQETLLPNLVYVGGGGEISYWIQQKGIFDALGLTYPLLSVRNSLQVLDISILKKMEKLNLTWEDTFKPLLDLQRNYLQANSGDELDFTSIDTALDKLSEALTKQATLFDQNIEKFVEAEHSKLTKQIEGIKAKFTKQRKGQLEVAMKQIEDLKTKLFPNNGLQERSESFFSFCKDGNVSQKIDLVKNAMDPFENDLIVLLLD